jgi:hypothetical protein
VNVTSEQEREILGKLKAIAQRQGTYREYREDR